MKHLAWRTAFPAFLAFALFAGVVFFYLLPSVDRVVMDQKRLMIRELTESAWNVLARFEAEVETGSLSRQEAQRAAISQVRNLHYGQESKDYFWIIDMHPHMVVHPYRPDLEGTDLTDFLDPHGQALFVEMAELVRQQGAGYVNYMWQWKDDSQRIVPKLSYVKGYQPWGWVLGTGVYTEDVDAEIASLKENLQLAIVVILLLVSLLYYVLLRASFQAETGRLRMVEALRGSEEKYKALVESAGEAILMSIAGEGLYANASLLSLLGYDKENEFAQLDVADIIEATEEEAASGLRHWQAVTEGLVAPTRYEAELVHRQGDRLRVMLTLSRIVVQERIGFMAVAAQFSQPRELDIHTAENLDDLEAASRRTRDLGSMMMNQGADSVAVSTMLSAGADAVVKKAVDFIVTEMGSPPVPFDIMLMGSLGRSEVTFSADQDHALIYDDVHGQDENNVRKYFIAVGIRLSDLLNASGYPYCPGKIMSSEEAWCQPRKSWFATFDGWVNSLEPEDLLRAQIFFDFRSALQGSALQGSALGGNDLVTSLYDHLNKSLANNPRFYPMLARNILSYEPPLKSFGALDLTATEDGRMAIDIKGAMAQLVDVVRLRSLQGSINKVGTLERITALQKKELIQKESAEQSRASFLLLHELRLRHQARRRSHQQTVDNMMAPETLSPNELDELKQALRHIKSLQAGIQLEFGTPS